MTGRGRPAATAENEAGGSPYVLLCEHASNFIPAEYAGLGLPESELQRHIAWDIGAPPRWPGCSRRNWTRRCSCPAIPGC